MLNCLFFRIFSSVSFVSLYQTKAQRSGFCLELRSKGAERGMPSPAGRYTRSGLCDEVVGAGFCPQTAFGREPVDRRLAKCDAGSSRTGGFFPPRRDFSALGWRIAPAFFTLPARRRNVGFFCRAAHTLAGWAKSRTQRQHAAHSAVQALGTPAGSIGSIFSTVGRSAPSTLFRQINRSPLLFRNDTKMPFFLRASMLLRI